MDQQPPDYVPPPGSCKRTWAEWMDAEQLIRYNRFRRDWRLLDPDALPKLEEPDATDRP